MFGLRDHDIDEIIAILQDYPEVQEACIFGSRSMGNYKNGSDVDISLKGTNLNYNLLSKINGILNGETLMPYHFDLVNYHDIKNAELIAHIDRVGKLIYKKEIVPVLQEPPNNYDPKTKDD